MRHTITKEDEGNIIYALPTGNNARRLPKDHDPIKFMVKKVKRKYVDLVRVYDDGTEVDIGPVHPRTGATQHMINAGYGGNAGYMFFKSKYDIFKHSVEVKMRKDITEFFKLINFKLNYEDIEKIHNIIEDKK